jgi:CAAX prenyl protease-like protein
MRSPLAAHVLPFALFIGALALLPLARIFGGNSIWAHFPEQGIYPLQTLLCGAALLYFWKAYSWGKRQGYLFAAVAGLAVLGLWIAPQVLFGFPPRLKGFDPTLFESSPFLYWTSLLARFARLVIVVPVLEELFWRGFLMRFLIKEDFTNVPIGAFQWRSFFIVAVAFMLVHQAADWPAALLCGIAYNLVAVRTGSLSACILAHAITNLGLGIYIMSTRQWGFW